MGFSKKHQLDGGEFEGKKWVIAGISIRAAAAPLKPISTGKPKVVVDSSFDVDEDDSCSTTPTAKEARIQKKLSCPPAPRKRRPAASTCHVNGVREFFNPPDLESVFIKLERAIQ